MAPGALPPRPDAVDWRQVRAITRITLLTARRPPLNPATGARSRSPLVAMTIFGLLFGAILASAAGRFADLESYLPGLFVTTFLQAAFAVGPASAEQRQRGIDLIHTKPLSAPTLHVARLLEIGVLIGYQTTWFAAPQLIAARLAFGAPWLVIAGLAVAVLAAMLVAVAGWRSIIVLAQTRLSTERVRMVNLSLMLATLLGSMGYAFGVQQVASGGPIRLADVTWVRALPPVWFADAVAAGFDAQTNLERAGAALVFAGALALYRFAARFEVAEAHLGGAVSAGPVRRPASVRALDAARGAIDRQAYAVARLVLLVTAREETARFQVVVARTVMLVLAVSTLARGSFESGAAVLGAAGYLELAGAVRLVSTSSSPEASWLFSTSPADALRLVRGMRLAVLARGFPLAGAIAAVAFVSVEGPWIGAALVAGFFVQARLFVSAYFALSPSAPLARDVRDRTGTLLPTVVFQVMMAAVGAAGYALVAMAVRLGAAAGAASVVGGLAAALLVDMAVTRAAGRRLAGQMRLEGELRDDRPPGPLGAIAPARVLPLVRRPPVAVLGGAALGAALFGVPAALTTWALAAAGHGGVPSPARWTALAYVAWTLSVGAAVLRARSGRRVRRSSEAARAVVLTFALAFVWLVAWVATPWAYVVAAGRAPAAVPALRALGLDLEATIGRRVTALDLAVASGDARAAEVLMANGARVDGPGRLSLAYAVFRGDTATLGAMLAHGADPDARIAPDGTTALIGSIMRGDDAARVLLDAGADPNLANAAGVTPLMLAAQNRNGAAVRLLLERGADVNARDARGSTSLMYAARALDRDGMEALRRAGADPSVEDAFGRTAADVFAGAEAEGDDEEADDEDGEA